MYYLKDGYLFLVKLGKLDQSWPNIYVFCHIIKKRGTNFIMGVWRIQKFDD